MLGSAFPSRHSPTTSRPRPWPQPTAVSPSGNSQSHTPFQGTGRAHGSLSWTRTPKLEGLDLLPPDWPLWRQSAGRGAGVGGTGILRGSKHLVGLVLALPLLTLDKPLSSSGPESPGLSAEDARPADPQVSFQLYILMLRPNHVPENKKPVPRKKSHMGDIKGLRVAGSGHQVKASVSFPLFCNFQICNNEQISSLCENQ